MIGTHQNTRSDVSVADHGEVRPNLRVVSEKVVGIRTLTTPWGNFWQRDQSNIVASARLPVTPVTILRTGYRDAVLVHTTQEKLHAVGKIKLDSVVHIV